MLVRLYPAQVADNWSVLSYGIQQSLPPITYESPKRLQKILEHIMLKEMDLWVGVEDEKVKGLILTTPIHESNSDVSDLLIYSIYGFDKLGIRMIKESIDTLKKYAVAKGLKRITAYSNVDSVIRMIKALGGEESWTYLSIPANGVMQ